MNRDRWVTPEEMSRFLLVNVRQAENVVRQYEGGFGRDADYLHAKNKYGVSLASVRVYDGTEHPNAQAGMCLLNPERTASK